MSRRRYPQVKSMGSVAALVERLAELGLELPVDDEVRPGPDGALARPVSMGPIQLANRFAILPMEGWDATSDGRPTDLVRRRWRRFGAGGASLIWGGEAVAVTPEGRANPNQLCVGPDSAADLAELRSELVAAHEGAGHDPAGLAVGLQLTHSGRWSRPDGEPRPRTAQRHPVLDRRVGVTDDGPVLADAELEALVGRYVEAAEMAAGAGFSFVDVKACHGYLLHELLGAFDRPPPWGGTELADRARMLLSVIAGIRQRVPELSIGVRLSAFDVAPYRPGQDHTGVPDWSGSGPGDEPARFGGAAPYATGPGTGPGVDLDEPLALIDMLAGAGVGMICVSAGSPYYNPHIQRPAYFPPSDGYQPPEDPLVGVVRLAEAAARISAARSDLVVVGSGLSYLQDYLPHVASALVSRGWMDLAGLGRMALSYPDMPADVLAGRPIDRRAVCRTFSDCTTAPRHGMVSGCYPLDDHYREMPERSQLAEIKSRIRRSQREETR